MGEGRRHRNYDAGFKREAVRLVTERGIAVSKVAEDLGIHPAMLARWKRESLKDRNGSFPGKGHMRPEQEKLLQLERYFKKSLRYILTTRQEAMLSIFEYIEVFYNRIRRHSALGYKGPAEYERLQNAA